MLWRPGPLRPGLLSSHLARGLSLCISVHTWLIRLDTIGVIKAYYIRIYHLCYSHLLFASLRLGLKSLAGSQASGRGVFPRRALRALPLVLERPDSPSPTERAASTCSTRVSTFPRLYEAAPSPIGDHSVSAPARLVSDPRGANEPPQPLQQPTNLKWQ